MASTNITTFPGKVGVSNANPTHTLSIGSNVFVDDTGTNKLVVLGSISTTGTLSGDGSGISNIQSSNVNDFVSNVTRIGTLETDLDDNSSRISTVSTDLDDNSSRISTVSTDLDDNSSRISTVSTDLSDNSSRISTVSTDLSDNSSRITVLESGDTNITGKKTFTEQVTFESNIHVKGDLLVANTVNMTVSDPILELGSNNLNTGDIGLVMTRHGASNSNVAVFFDETADTLKLGYTLNGAGDSTLEFDSNALAVSIQGTLEVDTANVNTMNVSAIEGLQTLSFSSDSTTVPPLQLTAGSLNDGVGALRIDSVEPDIFLNDTDGGFSTVTFANNDVARAAFGRNNGDDFYITVRDPATNGGNWRNTTLVVDSSSGNVSMAYGLTVGSNLGIGTTSPDLELHVHDANNANSGIVLSSTTGYHRLYEASGQLYFQSGTTASADSRADINFTSMYASTTYMKILGSNGNVGIGTASPSGTLHVNGENIYISSAAVSNCTWRIMPQTGNATKLFRIYDQDNARDRLVIDASGNVGIGTASPTHNLEVNGTMRHNGLSMSSGTTVDQLTTITKSLQITTTWMDTGIKSTDLVTGTYIVQIYNVDDYTTGGLNYDETYSGLMSWYDGNTNSTESTEILLTAAGHAPNNNHIYLRVQRTLNADTNNLKLQIRKDRSLTSAYTYTFKFRRMI